MKKNLTLLFVVLLILSGVGITALPAKEIKEEKMTLFFSQFLVNQKDDCITLELEETDSGRFSETDSEAMTVSFSDTTSVFGVIVISTFVVNFA